MEGAWGELGHIITSERSRRWRTRKEFAAFTGLSTRTIGNLERGAATSYAPATLGVIEAALGWTQGTCLRVVAGGRPRHIYPPDLMEVIDAWPMLSRERRSTILAVVRG